MAGKTRNEASSSRKTPDNNGVFAGGGGQSMVLDHGRRRSSCGYCKSPGPTSVSHGLMADSLTVNDYQDLLDRGWRRSGSFIYKPEMEKTCCPSYTIRLRADDFVPSKEHLRVTRRFERFLEGYLDSNKPIKLKEDSNASKESHSSANVGVSSSVEEILQNLSNVINNAVHTCVENGEFPIDVQLPKASVKKVSQGKRKLYIEGSETLLYSSSISFQIASAIKKRAEPGKEDVPEKEVSPKTIAEKLAISLNQVAETSGLSVKACNGHINFYSGANQASLDKNAQIVTISSKAPSSQSSSKQSPVKRRKLEIRLKRSSFDPEEYALYRRYQMKVHNDKPDRISEISYKMFLVDTPLIFVPPTGDGTVPPCGFGSFHQQYLIDGRLVAVGVVDILPKCLSSKYLFWDPDFAFLSLGKYSALQEVNWVKENQINCPSLQFYYLGYYIHSCNKMRYKATYRPSELLCPLRYQWVSFDVAKSYLDKQRYVVLSDCALLQDGESSELPNASETAAEDFGLEHPDNEHMQVDEEAGGPVYRSSDDESCGEYSDTESVQTESGDLSNMLIGLNGANLKYKELQRALHPAQSSYLEPMLHKYLRVVGEELGERMVYSLG